MRKTNVSLGTVVVETNHSNEEVIPETTASPLDSSMDLDVAGDIMTNKPQVIISTDLEVSESEMELLEVEKPGVEIGVEMIEVTPEEETPEVEIPRVEISGVEIPEVEIESQITCSELNMSEPAEKFVDVAEIPTEVASGLAVENNERQALLPLKDAFKHHLAFPQILEKKNKNKENLPSAISSDAWRNYYNKKENEKKEKIKEKERKKEERELKKQQTQRLRKNVPLNKTKEPEKSKKKEMCTVCQDELNSDAEDDGDKNIGCDFCPRWFHLDCTEYSDLPYAVAAEKDV